MQEKLGKKSICLLHFVLMCFEKSSSKCELLVFPVLESRSTVLRRVCAISKPKAENLRPFQDNVPAPRELGKQPTNTGNKL